MNAVPQLRAPPLGSLPSLRTTKPGKLRFSLPRPQSTHEPRLGRPARIEPVFIWQTPPTCNSASDQHERTTHRSSAQVAVCGSQSEISRPDWPCFLNVRLLARSLLLVVPIAVMG